MAPQCPRPHLRPRPQAAHTLLLTWPAQMHAWWEDWKREYNKQYSAEEAAQAEGRFRASLAAVQQHNAALLRGAKSHWLTGNE